MKFKYLLLDYNGFVYSKSRNVVIQILLIVKLFKKFKKNE